MNETGQTNHTTDQTKPNQTKPTKAHGITCPSSSNTRTTPPFPATATRLPPARGAGNLPEKAPNSDSAGSTCSPSTSSYTGKVFSTSELTTTTAKTQEKSVPQAQGNVSGSGEAYTDNNNSQNTRKKCSTGAGQRFRIGRGI